MGHTEKVTPLGSWQKGVYDLLYYHITYFNALLAKLDDDGGVADVDYESTLAITDPTIGATYKKDVQPNGMLQGDMVSLCKQLRTNWNALMDKLAADGTVNGITIFTGLKFGSTAFLIDASNAGVKALGVHDGDLADFFDQINDRFNKLLKVLDTDSGVTDTDYYSTYGITDVVTETSSSSSSSSSCRSSSSSSSSSSCRSSSSSSCRSSSSSSSSSSLSSSSSSCRSSSSSSSSSSCRSSSSSSSCRSSSSSSSSSSCRSSSSSSSSCRSSSSSSCRSSSSSSCRSSSSSSSSSSCRSSSSSSSSSQAIS